MDWDLKKAKKAEMDLAIDAILRECTTKTLFCYGNGSFRTGINLASPHESFKAVFAQKVKVFFFLLSLFPVSCVCPIQKEQILIIFILCIFMKIGCCCWAHRGVG